MTVFGLRIFLNEYVTFWYRHSYFVSYTGVLATQKLYAVNTNTTVKNAAANRKHTNGKSVFLTFIVILWQCCGWAFLAESDL